MIQPETPLNRGARCISLREPGVPLPWTRSETWIAVRSVAVMTASKILAHLFTAFENLVAVLLGRYSGGGEPDAV